MISYTYWQSRFGGDPSRAGADSALTWEQTDCGVLPPDFRFPINTDIWISAVGPP